MAQPLVIPGADLSFADVLSSIEWTEGRPDTDENNAESWGMLRRDGSSSTGLMRFFNGPILSDKRSLLCVASAKSLGAGRRAFHDSMVPH